MPQKVASPEPGNEFIEFMAQKKEGSPARVLKHSYHTRAQNIRRILILSALFEAEDEFPGFFTPHR